MQYTFGCRYLTLKHSCHVSSPVANIDHGSRHIALVWLDSGSTDSWKTVQTRPTVPRIDRLLTLTHSLSGFMSLAQGDLR